MHDTIFAVSSGAPPAAIGIIRISGPDARTALEALAGPLPAAKTASLRTLRDLAKNELDQALVLWFPGPNTATGEDLVEFHCHGGRAVLNAVQRALKAVEGLREAEAGEFTRRAFANGRIDLAQADGLADILTAETELQRLSAQAAFGGRISKLVAVWRTRLLELGAHVEAILDFSDEDDVRDEGGLDAGFVHRIKSLVAEFDDQLSRPTAERLRNGVRVVLAGPPNSGKSSLFNALVDDSAAITSPIAGTTRDVIERPIALGGVPIVLVDTAGLHEGGDDEIEAIGIERAEQEVARADIVLWLGKEGEGPDAAIEIQTKSDLGRHAKARPDFVVSSVTNEGVDALEHGLIQLAGTLLPKPGAAALNARQRNLIASARDSICTIDVRTDLLIAGEQLREARVAFDRLVGSASTEDMLDNLFGRFCIGK